MYWLYHHYWKYTWRVRRNDFDSIDLIYKKQVSPLFLLDTSSSFYHIYSIKGDFPYLAIRKVGHFIFYGFIAISLSRAEKRNNLFLNGVLATMLTIGIGILDEVYQYLLVGRSGRMLDIGIDAAGSFVFVIIYLLAKGLGRRRDRSAFPLDERGT